MSLYQRWIEAKQIEAAAVEDRRALEDQMLKAMNIPQNLNGTSTRQINGYKIKVESRINRKIDADKLQEIAAETGLTEHLSSLFRWKPEINTKVWNAADEAVTRPLLDAITSTPGRPTFTITKEE
jgi:hypothetical protein